MAIKYNLKTAGPNLTSREIQEIPFATLTGVDVEYAENGEYTVNPPTGFDGLSSVNVTVDVPTTTLGSTTVNPSTSQQVIEAATGTGFDTITVNAVTAAIDSNITAGNIKKDVEILGITGTFDPTPSLGTLTATANGTYTAAGVDGYDEVIVNVAPNLATASESYTANGTFTVSAPTGYDGLSSVEVTVDVAGGVSWGYQLSTYKNIFQNNTTLTASDLSSFVGSTRATAANNMFQGCSALTSVPSFAMSGVKEMHYMFTDSGLTTVTLDVSSISGPDSPYGAGGMNNAFQGCRNLQSVNLIGWSTNIKTFMNLFRGCSSLTSVSPIDISGVNDYNAYSAGYPTKGLIGMFQDCTSLASVSLTGASCPNLTSTSDMFGNCRSLVEAPLFDTSNVRAISSSTAGYDNGMFGGCSSLTTVPLYDFGNVIYMQAVFEGCSLLTTIPQFNTSNVENMRSLFRNCSSLQSVPLLDTTKVTQVSEMFYGCTALTTLSGFTNMGKAFTTSQPFDLTSCTLLTYQSIMNVINNLVAPDAAGVQPRLNISATTASLLSDVDKQKVSNAGWILYIDGDRWIPGDTTGED